MAQVINEMDVPSHSFVFFMVQVRDIFLFVW